LRHTKLYNPTRACARGLPDGQLRPQIGAVAGVRHAARRLGKKGGVNEIFGTVSKSRRPRANTSRVCPPPVPVRTPKGDDWLHEPKWDGFRFLVMKDGSDVRLHSKGGADYGNKVARYAQSRLCLSRTRSPFSHFLPKWTYPRVLLLRTNDHENDGHNKIDHNVSRNSKRHEPKSKALGHSNKDVKKLNHLSDVKGKP
jgi:hypothetical protein